MKRVNRLKIVDYEVESFVVVGTTKAGNMVTQNIKEYCGTYKTEAEAIKLMAGAITQDFCTVCIARNNKREGQLLRIGLIR